MNIEQTTINNIKTLFINSPSAKASTVQIWFRAGSSLEKTEEEGIAHFLEHMFFKGTPKYPGPSLAHAIESFGGEVNAFTSFDYTCYYINCPSSHLQEATDILLDMVSNPLFTNDEIPAEREVVFEEYRRAIDNPSQFHFMQLQKASMGGPYAHPILGREDTIKNFTQDQVKSFRQRFYNFQNSMLVIAGDLEKKEELTKKISHFHLPTGDVSLFSPFRLKNKNTIDFHEKPVRQATLTLAIQAPSYHHDQTAAQDLAINCLAHGETSYLYQNLVAQTSLCNGVAGSTMYFADGGCHFLKMNFPIENISKVLDGFYETLKNILKNGFSEADVNKIKSQYLASKIYEKESVESYAFSLGHSFAQDGNIFCEEEFIKRIKQSNLRSVQHALTEIFSQPLHLNLQTPQKTLNNSIKAKLQQITTKIQKLVKESDKNAKKHKSLKIKDDSQLEMIQIGKGLKLIYRHSTLSPTFVMHAYLKGGLTDEISSNCGHHALLSRLLNYGFKGMPYHKLKNELEIKSASLNGFSGKNAFGITMHGQSEHFSDLFKYFSQTLLKPELPNKYFQHERKVILRILENQKEDPVKLCFRKFNQMIYHLHPYSLDISGTPESLKNTSIPKLKKLHRDILKNNELILTYCGDQSLDEVIDQIKLYFPLMWCQKPKVRKKKSLKPQLGEKHHIELSREQTHIMLGTNAFKLTDEEDIYLKMITSHLSGMSSELFVEVRDKLGLCYAVQPIHQSGLEAGAWGIYIGSGSDKVEKAINAIIDILNNLAENGLKKSEFDRIKKMIEGQQELALQTNEDWAQLYSIPVLHGLGLDYPYKNHQKIKNATYENFQKFLAKFMKRDWNIVSVGPTV